MTASAMIHERVKLADLIPDAGTREFIRWLDRHSGRDTAAAFVQAIYDGTLIDLGEGSISTGDAPTMPRARDATQHPYRQMRCL